MNYTKIYNNLIEKARSRILEGYQEKHHVIPRCMNGTNDITNLVGLTPEEHYIAHLLLVKIYPEHKGLIYAAWYMQYHDSDKRKNNKSHGWLQRLHAETVSIRSREMWETNREAIVTAMIAERNTLTGKERMKVSAQKRWDDMDEVTRNNFNLKMQEVNSNSDKKEKAGKSIKANWDNQEFKDKMKTRKTRGSDGSALKKKWDDPIWRESMLASRREKKFQKESNETN
jgi:hypothetical protein